MWPSAPGEREVEEHEHWSLEGGVGQPLEGQPAIGDMGAVWLAMPLLRSAWLVSSASSGTR